MVNHKPVCATVYVCVNGIKQRRIETTHVLMSDLSRAKT